MISIEYSKEEETNSEEDGDSGHNLDESVDLNGEWSLLGMS